VVHFSSFPLHVLPTDSTLPTLSSLDLCRTGQRARAVLSARPELIQVHDLCLLWHGMPRVWIGGQAQWPAVMLLLCGKDHLRRPWSKRVALPLAPQSLWHLALQLLPQPVCRVPKPPLCHLLDHKEGERGLVVRLAPSPYDAVESPYLAVDRQRCLRFQPEVRLGLCALHCLLRNPDADKDFPWASPTTAHREAQARAPRLSVGDLGFVHGPCQAQLVGEDL
jgi:hypothetical protein